MDEALLSPATPGTAQSWPCCVSKCSVPGDPGSKGGSPQKCGTGGSLPGSGPQSGKPDGEAASQAPGPALLTFSRPTPPRSCLHFRPHAAGSAKKLGLALLAWGRTPGTRPVLPPPQKSPGMGWQQGALSLHFSETSIRCITPVSSIPLQQILPSPSVPQFLWQPSTERHRQILPTAEDKALEPRHLQEAPLTPLHEQALTPLPSLAPKGTGTDPNSHCCEGNPLPQDPSAPLNQPHPSTTAPKKQASQKEGSAVTGMEGQ